ncbi:MAG TPA: DUF2905 domain-containing protein [Acidobacteriota bacterium]|nr:DUF2905 domain-containing protein [Acidobacteriota bacterium]
MLDQIGKVLIVAGAVIALFGLVLLLAGRVPFFGKLPGDLVFRGRHVTIYVPLVTMLLISLAVTILLNLFGRGR